ncbi:MAG: phosphotransferase enzyme family protein [Rhodanobacter sp.]
MQSSPTFAPTVAHHYGLQVRGATQAVGARVWRLPTTCGDVAVKQFTLGEHAQAAKEADLLAHLATHADPRFRTQKLLRTTMADTTQSTADGCFLVTRWETGSFKSYDRFSPDEWRALGRSLAALHLSLDAMQKPAAETLSARLRAINVDDERRRIAQDRARLPVRGSLDTQRLRDYLDTCLRMIDRYYPGSIEGFPADELQHPIHNDYNQFNYLFGDSLPPLVLDWEASIGAPREFEVVRCLNHLPLESAELAGLFVRAYLQVRPLHAERIAWAVDTAGLMHALKHWLLHGWLDDPARFETRLQGALHIAAILADARQRLLDFYVRSIETGA